jgi:endonuclease/exonuclease/phosphatase family metal-dependent hydrolase
MEDERYVGATEKKRQYNHAYLVLAIGIVTFFLIEAFYNTCLYVTSVLFINLGVMAESLPSVLLYLTFIFIFLALFGSKLIKPQVKLFAIVLIILVARVFAQFYLSSEIYLLVNLSLLLGGVLFFLELFITLRRTEVLQDFQVLIGGIILGVGINYALYLLNLSSNLTTELTKLPFTIAFIAILMALNIVLFRPKLIQDVQDHPHSPDKSLGTKNLHIFHFFLIGILFFFTLSWILSPVTLSAYDPLNLQFNNLAVGSSIPWPFFGFSYYIFTILIAATASFFIIRHLISFRSSKVHKLALLVSNVLACLLNSLALMILDISSSLLSSVYLTALVFCSVFALLFNLAFFIHSYAISSRVKAYFGIFFFIVGLILSVIIEILISWVQYSSMLISILIFSLLVFPCLFTFSIRNCRHIITQKLNCLGKKLISAFFAAIFILNFACFGFLAMTRSIEPPLPTNPTFMVWNIHNAIGVDTKYDADRLVAAIRANNPDVLGLNEVDMGSMKTGFIDLASYIAYKLHMWVYYGPSFYKHYGNAILSKYPILEAETFPLPIIVEGAEPRCVIRTRINVTSEVWTVYVTHLSTKHDDRLAQVDYNYSNSVVSIINQSAFTHVVWMGDFNFEPTSEEYAKLNASSLVKFRDTYPYLNSDPGYTGGFDEDAVPHRRIDYILSSPDLVPTTSWVTCSLGSDHCAVVTQF